MSGGESVWVILPTYNEAANIERLLRSLVAELEGTGRGHRVLVVDDASPDGTGAMAQRLSEELPAISVLHRKGKEGLGPAYLAGFDKALSGGAELVISMDSDFSHDPAAVPALIAAADHSDLVIGSRYVEGGVILDWPRLRRALSWLGSTYARRLLGVRLHDLTGGFTCMRREVLETVQPGSLRSQGYVFNIELKYRALLAGFRVTEVPITFRDRAAGASKMSLPIAFEALWLVPSLRRRARQVPEVREALERDESEPAPAGESSPAARGV